METINPETGEIITLEKPTQSTEIDKLTGALAKAQGQLVSAPRDAANPFFKSSYATLDSIWSVCREPLSTNGLAVIQIPMFDDTGMYLITTLAHLSGQWIRSYYRVKPTKDDTPQGIGSALTYARRYAMSAIVGISTAEDDDDGNAASQPGKTAPAKQPQPKPAQPNGKPANVPNTADDLLSLVNKRVTVTYDNVPHLFNAIRNEIDDGWTWPEKNDVDGWRKAYKAAVDHAKAKEQPATDTE